MKENKNKKDISKGEFQHKMFKLVILIIAFIFCCLIGGFIYITISSSSPRVSTKILNNKFSTEESILESNEKYYKIISNLDKDNYALLNNNLTKKSLNENFYKTYIYRHIPCMSNNDLNNLADKYLKFLSSELYIKNNNNEEYFKTPRMNNIGRICINKSEKSVQILLSPISQIKYFNTYQKKSNSEIINLYLKENLDEKINIIYYEFTLNKSDYIYIPSFYFIQIKEPIENFMCKEYQDISLFNDMIFKILFDDN